MSGGTCRVVDARTGAVFLERCGAARSLPGRMLGLMFRAGLAPGTGLLIAPARGIHTHFMRFPIDLVYLDRDNRISAIRPAMPPWRMDGRHAAAVIEAPAGSAAAAGLQVGDRLEFACG